MDIHIERIGLYAGMPNLDMLTIVVGEDGPGHEMERSFMEGEDSLNCGVGSYRGYIEMRRQGAETDGSRSNTLKAG